MSDVFDEIDEALKQEKFEDWWKKNGGYIIWFCSCLVIFTALTGFVRGWIEDNKQAETAALVSLYETNDAVKLLEYGANNKGDLSVLASLNAAQQLIIDEKFEEAFASFKQIAESGETIYHEYARLLYVIHQLNENEFTFETYKTLLEFLNPILELKSPWMSAALELRATIETQMGLFDNAMTSYLQITELPNVPQERVTRAFKLYEVARTMKEIGASK